MSLFQFFFFFYFGGGGTTLVPPKSAQAFEKFLTHVLGAVAEALLTIHLGISPFMSFCDTMVSVVSGVSGGILGHLPIFYL